MSALKASLGMGAMPNRWANDESMLRRAFLRWRALVAAALGFTTWWLRRMEIP